MKRFNFKGLALTACCLVALTACSNSGRNGVDLAATAQAEAGIFEPTATPELVPTVAPSIPTAVVRAAPTALPTTQAMATAAVSAPQPPPPQPTETPDFAPLRCVTKPYDADNDGSEESTAGWCTGGVWGNIPLP